MLDAGLREPAKPVLQSSIVVLLTTMWTLSVKADAGGVEEAGDQRILDADRLVPGGSVDDDAGVAVANDDVAQDELRVRRRRVVENRATVAGIEKVRNRDALEDDLPASTDANAVGPALAVDLQPAQVHRSTAVPECRRRCRRHPRAVDRDARVDAARHQDRNRLVMTTDRSRPNPASQCRRR